MANWERLTDDIAERFGLGFKAHTLVQELLRSIGSQLGGVHGFLAKVRAAGLEKKEESWLRAPYPMALSVAEVRKALGDQAIRRIAKKVGISEGSVSRILGYVIPNAIGLLTEDGAIPGASRPASWQSSGSLPARVGDSTAGRERQNPMFGTLGDTGATGLRLMIPGVAVVLTLGLFGFVLAAGTAGDQAFFEPTTSVVAQNAPVEPRATPSLGEKTSPLGEMTSGAANPVTPVQGANPAANTSLVEFGARDVTGDLSINAGWIKNLGAAANGSLGNGNVPAFYAANEFNIGGKAPSEDRTWSVGSLHSAQVPQFTVAEIRGAEAPGMRIAWGPPQQPASSGMESATNEAALKFPTINFAYKSARVPENSLPLLRQVADEIKQLPSGTSVQVNGYADSKGRPAFNLKLSQKRANSVSWILVRYGVRPGMLKAKGYGSSASLAGTSETAEGRSTTGTEWPSDRRVEFRIVPRR